MAPLGQGIDELLGPEDHEHGQREADDEEVRTEAQTLEGLDERVGLGAEGRGRHAAVRHPSS